ncbi:MAG: HAD family hydrolase [Actinomycetota bacterium]
MPEPDAILFDLYDTLVWADWSGMAEELADRLEVAPAAVELAYEDLRHARDGGELPDAESVLVAVARHCGVEPGPALVADLVAWEERTLARRVVLYEDAVGVLRRLRAGGLRTGVVSNCSPSTRPVVDRLGLGREADAVVLSCEVGAAKPAAVIYEVALQAVGVEAARSVFVDDRADYLDGAAALGMRTVQIRRPNASAAPASNHRWVGGLHPLVGALL